MDSSSIIFGIVMLHLVAGFGYVFYKLQVKPKNKVTKH